MTGHEAFLLEEAEQWLREGLITPELHERLRVRYAGPAATRRQHILVRAALAIGVVLVLLGTGRLLVELKLGFLAWTSVQVVLAALALGGGFRLHRERPEARSGPALIYMGAMFFLGALGLGGYTFELWNRLSSPWLLLFGGAAVGGLGWAARFFTLHAIGLALACSAAGIWLHQAGLPLNWVPIVVGLAVAALGACWRWVALPQARGLYMAGGLGLAALAGWSLELGAEPAMRGAYALLFSALAAFPLGVGLRDGDDMLAGLGILLLVLDVYTQYYCWLWGFMPRTAFFLIGGALTLGGGIAYERGLHRRWLGSKPIMREPGAE